jgi:RimJ/RimL family protein N-acetyltransferase
MTPILETPRLFLREMGESEHDFLTEQLGDPDVMRYWPRPLVREEAMEWIQRQRHRYANDGYGYWLMLDKASGAPVGQAGVMMTEAEGTFEAGLGWIVHRPFWRNGYASEAGGHCRNYAFEILGHSRVIALVRPENEPSLGVARKLGMFEERRIRYKDFEHIVFASARP